MSPVTIHSAGLLREAGLLALGINPPNGSESVSPGTGLVVAIDGSHLLGGKAAEYYGGGKNA